MSIESDKKLLPSNKYIALSDYSPLHIEKDIDRNYSILYLHHRLIMDKKSFFVLLYVAGIIPVVYDIILRLHVENPFFILGLVNILCLIIITIFIGMQRDKADMSKRRIKWRLFLVIAAVIIIWLFSGAIDRLLARWSLWFHEMIMQNNQITIAPSSSDVISWENQSGAIIMPDTTILSGTAMLSWQSASTWSMPTTSSWTIILEWSDDPALPTYSNTSTPSSITTKKWLLTYADVIPYLVKTYSVTMKGSKYPTLINISKSSALYSSFAKASSRGMIGKDINPTTTVSCKTYLVMKGIAAGWEVSYTWLPFDAYRAAAVSRGKVNGCDAGEYVRSTTL